jgi:hypothetical protein
MDGAPRAPIDQLKAKYSERWELLKEVMAWLYLGQEKKLKLKEIVEIMQNDYQFYAS